MYGEGAYGELAYGELAATTGTAGNASGSIASITIVAVSGSATGGASATGSIDAINIVEVSGSAGGAGGASGSIGSITVVTPSGSAIGAASSTGSIASVNIVAVTGSASSGAGAGNASGSIPSITIVAVTGSATGGASASGNIHSVTTITVSGSATGGVSDVEYTAWLKDQSALRCILVEATANVSSVETVRYMSNVGYITESTDTPASTHYLSIVNGGVKFTESLDLDSSAGLSFGDIEISNHNGIRDTWLDDVWVNRQIKVFIGDVRWARADFRTIFDGIVGDIDSKKRDVLNINILDKLQRLNTPVTESTLGGTTINQDVLLPTLLGECFNTSPLLTDSATLEYQVHDGAIESIIEVRDNGVPVSITETLGTGKFTLDQNPSGTITVSAQGDKPVNYENTVAQLVENLATNYGKSSEQFDADDIDNINLATFDLNNTQPVGIYMSSRTNVLTAINELADSVGAQAVMSRVGKLRLLKIELPATGTPIELTAYDMKESSLAVSDRVPVQSSVKIGYCKNWAVQSDLVTGIPQEHKDFFSEEWLSKTSTDAAVATKYKLDAEPEQKDTLLLDDTDATDEATRLLDIFKTPRTEYTFEGFANLIELELGDTVTITHDRYGMSGGLTGMVTRLQIDWMKFTVKVGVLI